MRQMKDSGIEWIGKIPEGWEVKKLKHMFSFGRGLPITKENLIEYGIPVINYGQIHAKENTGTTIKSSLLRFVDKLFLISNNDSLVKFGDIIFADTSEDYLGIGNSIFIDINSDIFAGYHTIICRPKSAKSSKYIAYLFQTDAWRSQLRKNISGIKVFSITQKILKETLIMLPPLAEQQRIADYLDAKCAHIDQCLELTRQSMEKLRAYKLSCITEAVTKGLDPDVPLKDSGVPWIGNIPKRWTLTKILRALDMPITDGPHETPEFFESGIPFISAESIKNEKIDFSLKRGFISEDFYNYCCNKYKPKLNDIYMIKSGATTGKIAIVSTTEKFQIWSPLAVFRVNSKNNYRFIFYSLQSTSFQRQIENNWSYGTQQNIGMRTLEKIPLPLPPLPEQERIAAYLDKKCARIDALLEEKQALLDKLAEYKKSLIFECVTGKREVPLCWNR